MHESGGMRVNNHDSRALFWDPSPSFAEAAKLMKFFLEIPIEWKIDKPWLCWILYYKW